MPYKSSAVKCTHADIIDLTANTQEILNSASQQIAQYRAAKVDLIREDLELRRADLQLRERQFQQQLMTDDILYHLFRANLHK